MSKKDTIISNAGRKLNILIAEDDDVSLELLKTLLSDMANKLFIAKTGKEAINIYENNPKINLILMDIKMPEMDGLEAAKRIRKLDKKIPIIAQTAFAIKGNKQEALKAGFNNYITKPLKTADLLKIIEDVNI